MLEPASAFQFFEQQFEELKEDFGPGHRGAAGGVPPPPRSAAFRCAPAMGSNELSLAGQPRASFPGSFFPHTPR